RGRSSRARAFRGERELAKVADLDGAGHRIAVDLASDPELKTRTLNVEVGGNGHRAGRKRASHGRRTHGAAQFASQLVAILFQRQRAGISALWAVDGQFPRAGDRILGKRGRREAQYERRGDNCSFHTLHGLLLRRSEGENST